jgi:hypothetical protein
LLLPLALFTLPRLGCLLAFFFQHQYLLQRQEEVMLGIVECLQPRFESGKLSSRVLGFFRNCADIRLGLGLLRQRSRLACQYGRLHAPGGFRAKDRLDDTHLPPGHTR